MHIIIDIRTSSSQDRMPMREGLAWAQLWKKFKKEDILSFLMYEYQEKIEGFDCIVAPQHIGPFGKKHIRPRGGKEIFRCVSFSSFSPYDTSIPTILHVSHNASVFYPLPTHSSWERKIQEYQIKQRILKSRTIVVPHIQVGRELVELYNIDEGCIEIIPYLPMPVYTSSIGPIQKIITPVPYFIYDSGYGNESHLLMLLTAWEHYRSNGGNNQLLLLGSAGSYLSELTQILRSLDLHESVRYLGPLDDGTLHELYMRSSGWISIGPYYSAGIAIEIARAYSLPLLLSDIPTLRDYPGLHVHPNHITEMSEAIARLEKKETGSVIHTPEVRYISAYEKILSKK